MFFAMDLMSQKGVPRINPVNVSETLFVGQEKPASDAEKHAGFSCPTMIQYL
jgi:hypothetical protein